MTRCGCGKDLDFLTCWCLPEVGCHWVKSVAKEMLRVDLIVQKIFEKVQSAIRLITLNACVTSRAVFSTAITCRDWIECNVRYYVLLHIAIIDNKRMKNHW